MPVEQAPAPPADLYQLIVVLTSQPVPAQWVDSGCQVAVAATPLCTLGCIGV